MSNDQLWTWADQSASGTGAISDRATTPVVGYDVQASDGNIGKIDEASMDVDFGHFVVDTGWWIFGKKRVIPAGVVSQVDDESKVVYVKCAKSDIKAAPDYDPDMWRQGDHSYQASVTDHYRNL
jgi:hypothetical protein